MRQKPDAVVTDLDGSLLGPDRQVGRRDEAAVKKLLELGVPVVLGTGRPPLGCRPLVEQLGVTLCLCANGGCCYDYETGSILFATLMDHGIARRLMDWLFGEGMHFLIHAPRKIYRTPGTGHISRYQLRGQEEDGLLTPGTSLDGVEILKILATDCDGPAECRRAKEVFSPEELSICSSDAALVDFNPPGVDKGRGLIELARAKGWDLENVLVLGDNYNDLPMFQAAALSAAPENCVEEIRPQVRFLTSPNGQDPLFGAVEHFFPGLLGKI